MIAPGRLTSQLKHKLACDGLISRRASVGRGHCLLGIAGSNSGPPSITEREASFVQAGKALGATVVVTKGQNTDYAGGLEAAHELLCRPDRPEAVDLIDRRFANPDAAPFTDNVVPELVTMQSAS